MSNLYNNKTTVYQNSFQSKLKLTKVSYFLFLVLFLSSINLFSKDLAELAYGKPNYMDSTFPKEQYVQVEVAKLAKPKLLWVNWPLLREMGYDLPDTITQANEVKILDALGWVAVDRHVNPSDIIANEKRTFFADLYGGSGLGINHGSARAASTGDVQIKGVGITPLLKQYDNKHTARSTIHEAIKDAVWGEVLHHELPFGANRIVAIIDRGGQLENGEPQILEIRQDPVRAGHFARRQYGSDGKDQNRNRLSGGYLLRNLPTPVNGFPHGADESLKIQLGLQEFSRRIGAQYAHLHMRRLFHGATSESNIEISGRMIDFGTASSQPGYGKIQFLEHIREFGTTDEIKSILLREFMDLLDVDGINKTVLLKQMLDTFESSYTKERTIMSLRFLGIPEQIVLKILDQHTDLAKQLLEIIDAETRQSSVIDLKKSPTLSNKSVSLLQKIIFRIHNLDSTGSIYNGSNLSLESILKVLSSESIPKEINKTKLASQLAEIFQQVTEMAVKEGIQPENLKKLMALNAGFLNRPLEAMYLPDLKSLTSRVTQQYLKGENTVKDIIRSIISGSYRSIKGLGVFQAPFMIQSVTDQSVVYRAYDATTDTVFEHEYSDKKKNLPVKPEENRKQNRQIRNGIIPICGKIFTKAG